MYEPLRKLKAGLSLAMLQRAQARYEGTAQDRTLLLSWIDTTILVLPSSAVIHSWTISDHALQALKTRFPLYAEKTNNDEELLDDMHSFLEAGYVEAHGKEDVTLIHPFPVWDQIQLTATLIDTGRIAGTVTTVKNSDLGATRRAGGKVVEPSVWETKRGAEGLLLAQQLVSSDNVHKELSQLRQFEYVTGARWGKLYRWGEDKIWITSLSPHQILDILVMRSWYRLKLYNHLVTMTTRFGCPKPIKLVRQDEEAYNLCRPFGVKGGTTTTATLFRALLDSLVLRMREEAHALSNTTMPS